MQRPQFNPDGLPSSLAMLAVKRAATQWCYVTPDGRTFYVAEEHARKMQERSGGDIYPPEAQ